MNFFFVFGIICALIIASDADVIKRCTTLKECGPGFSCSMGFCKPVKCKTDADCVDQGFQFCRFGICVDYDTKEAHTK
uniref:Uncharacterized protein n=1 Tax=Panagrolaimus davidi TaxID=227884 RepID=A0A914P7T2_9BILA